MEIPGIKDFYEGLNHELAHEIEQAAHEVQPPADGSHGSMRHDIGDSLGATHADNHHAESHHQEAHDDRSDQGGLFDSLLPTVFHGAAFGVARFAIEHLTEAALSETMLGAAPLHNYHHTQPFHVGSPDGDGFSHQTTGFTCAVVSQQMILHQFHLNDPQTGEPISEARLVYDATAHGWLSDQGTSFADLGRLLDHYGVANHEGHDWSHLVHDLASGHQVVMGVNADRLWHDHGPYSDFFNLFGNHPNHAVVIKGLKVDDHGKVIVVINDPGQGDGAGVEYPIEHFQSAIESAHLHYVATDHAPPDWSPGPAIQALCTQHLPSVSPESDVPATLDDTVSTLSDHERAAFLRNM